MRLKRRYIVFFCLTLMFISISDIKQARENTAITPAHQVNPIVNALTSEYDQYFREQMKSGYIPGAAVCIIKDDKIVLIKGYGIRDISTMDSVDIHTVFRIGSVSKSISSTLAGILVEDSLLNWDSTVKSYLPEFKLKSDFSTNTMLIKNILSHTTGLIRHTYTNFIEDGKTLEEIIPALSQVNLIGPPGTVYSYQNFAYGLIAPIIESVTGMDYETVLAEKLFIPMNMKDASASYSAIIHNPDVAYPHYFHNGHLSRANITSKYYNAAPAGGINVSIWDMANFMISATGHRPWVIDQATLNELYTPRIKTNIKYQYFGGWPKMRRSYYGLGFRILEYDNKKVVYHGGYVNGYRAGMAFLPEDNIGICILTNYSGNLANRGIRDFIDMYMQYENDIRDFEKPTAVTTLNTNATSDKLHPSLPPL